MQVTLGVHERSRTSGPTLRRRVLYPTELRRPIKQLYINKEEVSIFNDTSFFEHVILGSLINIYKNFFKDSLEFIDYALFINLVLNN